MCGDATQRGLTLMCGDEAEVELAAGQVVGDGVLGVLDVGDPVVGVDVVYAQQVEVFQRYDQCRGVLPDWKGHGEGP